MRISLFSKVEASHATLVFISRLVSARDHAPARKSSRCRPRLRVLACLIRRQTACVSGMQFICKLELSSKSTASKQAKQFARYCILCHFVPCADGSIIHFEYHFPSCPSFMSIMFPLLLVVFFQPSPAQPTLWSGIIGFPTRQSIC